MPNYVRNQVLFDTSKMYDTHNCVPKVKTFKKKKFNPMMKKQPNIHDE